MKTRIALLFVLPSLLCCQNGKLNITPQEQAAGIAALNAVIIAEAKGEKPKQAVLEAAQAALAAAANTPAASPGAP